MKSEDTAVTNWLDYGSHIISETINHKKGSYYKQLNNI